MNLSPFARQWLWHFTSRNTKEVDVKHLTLCKLHSSDGEELTVDDVTEPCIDDLNLLVEDLSEDTIEKVTEEILYSSHFVLVNFWPGIPGIKWPVSERLYYEMLGVVPPLPYKQKSEGFLLGEPRGHTKNGVLYSAFYKEAGQYWHEFVEVPDV